MRKAFIAAAALAAAISAPLAAQAQGTIIVEDRGTVGGPYIGIPSEQVTGSASISYANVSPPTPSMCPSKSARCCRRPA